jgi:CRP-like cAMP-binding protein
MGSPVDPQFLQSSDLFQNQPNEVLEKVASKAELLVFGPGEVIFNQGDPGDRLYVVQAGVVEIIATPRDGSDSRTVAYLGDGEVIGELALLTGSTRSATVKAPERAVLLSIEAPIFLELLGTVPAFARNLCVVLARRLEITTLNAPSTPSKQLQGNLKFFDLATVIQTLISSQQTGTLTVRSTAKKKIAEILFVKGNVARAKFRHLIGDDAVFQLFQTPVAGEFSFAGRDMPDDEVQADITMPAISLLMESVRLQDELPILKSRLTDPKRIFKQKAAQLAWEDDDNVELAAAVWSRLKKGASLDQLERDIPRCSYWVYKAVDRLLASGQIE